jgi:hypothetical protein
VPLVALAPLQPLEAVHDVALVELQVMVLELPDVMLEGEAEIVVVGAAGVEVPAPYSSAPASQAAPCGRMVFSKSSVVMAVHILAGTKSLAAEVADARCKSMPVAGGTTSLT